MFATLKYNPSFGLLLLLALPLLDHVGAQKNIGDWCLTSQGSGACQLISQCPPVLAVLRSVGTRPEVHCGYEGLTPIVCCPTENDPSIQISTSRISIRKCAEYERSFFGQVHIQDEGRRIFTNGQNAEAMEFPAMKFPAMVAIGYNNGSSISWDCGGTLISERFVLTAAQCLNSPQWGEAQWVRLGPLVSSEGNDDSRLLRIVEKIKHPDYRRSTKYNDIALLKLERSVSFNDNVRPACLDNLENHPAGRTTVVAGWGFANITDVESRSAYVLKVELPIVAHSNCTSFYSDGISGLPRGIDEQSQICAGENGIDTCQGDAGGPLIMKPRKPLSLPRLAGITSFGSACGSVAPGVYTRVSFYLSWIEGIVWPDKSM